ncbi:hypothetical protein SAMN05444422_102414 [Halobiforma haloterrestris]|uniref:DUF7344 domain-containing protein n=1 Tax=Natronobacterium haloterrestre TaxID=148448 RepID=A0A1I1EL06_NATHA|nr:hypothetical protein [Halobiforma haloterrestris]SFB85593.1 hypothetical protein SAMN05444422_102414 [Halobiforma haloterrestris]
MSESTHHRPPTDTDAESDSLSEREYHHLLAPRRRRMTLDLLAGRQEPVSLEPLASAIAARECGLDGRDEKTVETIAISLHHVHLPAMANAGAVDYDPEAKRVTPRPCLLEYDLQFQR